MIKKFFLWIHALKNKWGEIPSLQEAREKLLHGMLIAVTAIGLPAVIAGSLEAIEQNHSETSLLYSALYLIILVTTVFIRHIPFIWQSFVLMSELYILAFYTLLIYGFAGAGIHVLLTTSILSTLLHGGRAGVISILISLLIVGASGYLFCSETIALDPKVLNISTSVTAWGTAVFTFFMFALAMVVTSSLMQYFTEHSILNLEKEHQELTRSENRYRLLSETISDIILVYDIEGKITYINQSGAKAAGTELANLVGKSVYSYIPEIKKKENKFQKQSIKKESNSTHCFESQFISNSRSHLPVEVNVSILKDKNHQNEILLVARDISHRKEAEKAMHQFMAKLEMQVKEKTIALQERIDELEEFRDATVERELRMKELQDEIKRLQEKRA